jgi:hypothetical protein
VDQAQAIRAREGEDIGLTHRALIVAASLNMTWRWEKAGCERLQLRQLRKCCAGLLISER